MLDEKMIYPQQEHNSLLATREFLVDLMNEDKIKDVPEKVRLSARALLKNYPSRSRLEELYDGKTFGNHFLETMEERNGKVLNDNQTWETPGFKWKTEVEFISVDES